MASSSIFNSITSGIKDFLNPKPQPPSSAGLFVWYTFNPSPDSMLDLWENLENWGIGGIRPIPGLTNPDIASLNLPTGIGLGSPADRLPGANDNVLVIYGEKLSTGSGPKHVKSLRLFRSSLLMMDITTSSLSLEENSSLEPQCTVTTDSFTFRDSKNFGTIILKKGRGIFEDSPDPITGFKANGSFNAGSITVEGEGSVEFNYPAKNKGLNGSSSIQSSSGMPGKITATAGTVNFKGGSAIHPDADLNEQGAEVFAKNCTFFKCRNQGNVTVHERIIMDQAINGTVSDLEQVGSIFLGAVKAEARFINAAYNRALVSPSDQMNNGSSIDTFYVQFHNSKNIGNVDNIGKVEFYARAENYGVVRRLLAGFDADTVVNFYENTSNVNRVSVNVINFYKGSSNMRGQARNGRGGLARAIHDDVTRHVGVYFWDAQNYADVLGRFEFKGRSVNRGLCKLSVQIDINHEILDYRYFGYFRDTSANLGQVYSCSYGFARGNNVEDLPPYLTSNSASMNLMEEFNSYITTYTHCDCDTEVATIVFTDSATNYSGQVVGCVAFQSDAVNGKSAKALGVVTFLDKSENKGRAEGQILFRNFSENLNDGICDGRIDMFDLSKNYGQFSTRNNKGGITFAGKSENHGVVCGPTFGILKEVDKIYPLFTDRSVNKSEGIFYDIPDDKHVTFFGYSSNEANFDVNAFFIGGVNYGQLTGGYYVFTSTGINSGSVIGGRNISFDGSPESYPANTQYVGNGLIDRLAQFDAQNNFNPTSEEGYDLEARESTFLTYRFLAATKRDFTARPSSMALGGLDYINILDGAQDTSAASVWFIGGINEVDGLVNSHTKFISGGENWGYVNASAYFFRASNGRSGTFGIRDGYVTGNATFDGSSNNGNVISNAEFRDGTNFGDVAGSATFDNSLNFGIFNCPENAITNGQFGFGYLGGYCPPSGSVGGNASFVNNSYNGIPYSSPCEAPIAPPPDTPPFTVCNSYAVVLGTATFDETSMQGAGYSGM